MEITPAVTTISVDGNLFLQPYEEELRQTRIPRFFSNANEACLPTAFNAIAASRASELWAWNFSNDDKEVLVSIVSGDVNRFSKNDIPILKLVCESLESKLLELCLFKELDEKNLLINQIVEQQKEIIIKRTSEIEQKNKTLLEISVLNAHDVRKPLSRILGLISLFDFEPTDVITEEVIPKLKTSSNDLDTALQNIIKRVTSDLIHLKA